MPFRLSQKLTSSAADDVLHIDHPFEECNTDQGNMQEVDDETAAALLATGNARACGHCKPFAEAS